MERFELDTRALHGFEDEVFKFEGLIAMTIRPVASYKHDTYLDSDTFYGLRKQLIKMNAYKKFKYSERRPFFFQIFFNVAGPKNEANPKTIWCSLLLFYFIDLVRPFLYT